MKKTIFVLTLLVTTFLLVSCKPNRYDGYYTVVFYTDSVNSGVTVKTLEVEKDSKIIAPELDLDDVPAVFEGWYHDSQLTKPFDFDNTIISESITLYAKWRYPEYKVNYILAEDEINNDRNLTIFVPASYTDNRMRVRAASKEGYIFRGWYLGDEYPNSTILVDYVSISLYEDGEEQINLYPRWDKLN